MKFIFVLAVLCMVGCASQPAIINPIDGFVIDEEVGPIKPPRACRAARESNPDEVC